MNIPPRPAQNPLTALAARELEGVWRFAHQAMHTRFEIWIRYGNGVYAEQAARQAFHVLDGLEQNLSRFIPNSDIARLNSAPKRRPVRLDETTIRCLEATQQIFQISEGAFDITIGPLVQLWKAGPLPSDNQIRQILKAAGMRKLCIDTENDTATRNSEALQLDLGGIGKGFGVDCMADELRKWDIAHALIHGGASSVRAFGHPKEHKGWPVQISHPEKGIILSRFELKEEAMGASGLEKGTHILDPKTGRPVSRHRAVWIRGTSATETDGLSTACMILKPEQINRLTEQHSGLGIRILGHTGQSRQWGSWQSSSQ